jgi:hypothetical protein
MDKTGALRVERAEDYSAQGRRGDGGRAAQEQAPAGQVEQRAVWTCSRGELGSAPWGLSCLSPARPTARPLAGWSAFSAALSRRPLGADTLLLHAAIPRAATPTRDHSAGWSPGAWIPVVSSIALQYCFLQVLHILQYVQYWLLASIAHTMQYCNTDACGRDALWHESIRPVCATTCYNRHWGGFVGSVYERASHGDVVFWVEHAFYFRLGESEERTCPGICNTTDTCMCNTAFFQVLHIP